MSQKIKVQDGKIIYTTPDQSSLDFQVDGDVLSTNSIVEDQITVGTDTIEGQIVVTGTPGGVGEITSGISGDLLLEPGAGGSLVLNGLASNSSSLKINNYYWPNTGANLPIGVFLGASSATTLQFYSFYITPNATSNTLTNSQLNTQYPGAQPGQAVVGPSVVYLCVALGTWMVFGDTLVFGGSVSGNIVFTSGSTVTGLPLPSGSSDAASKAYVDSLIQGLAWKASVQAASLININLANPGTAIFDGSTLISGDRLLVKNQSTTSQNGIYIFNGSSSAMTRSSDANTGALLVGASVLVVTGSTQANTQWTQTTPAPITIGTTAIIWTQFGNPATYSAGAGLTLTGTTFSITPTGIGSSGPFSKITVNSLGQVVTGTNLSSSDIISSLGYTPANLAGATFTGTVSAPVFNSTSSRKYKDNIRSLSIAQLDKFDLLNPCEFKWNSGIKDDTDDFGFIAEEVDKIYPEIVNRDIEGYISGMDYSKLTTILTAKVQAQDIIIKELQKQINEILSRF